MKVIQLNAWAGKCLDAMVEYLQERKPDIVTLQEVTRGNENRGEDKAIDIFQHLKNQLGMRGCLGTEWRVHDNLRSYSGNAVLIRPELGIILGECKVYLRESRWLPTTHLDLSLPDCELLPRNAVELQVICQNQHLHIVSTHLAWSKDPVDTPEKIRQAEVFCQRLDSILRRSEPIILGGDFNCDPYSQVVGLIGERLNNWVAHTPSVSTTINSRLHRGVRHPLVIDYVCSLGFRLKKLVVPYTVDISDHFPIEAELELN